MTKSSECRSGFKPGHLTFLSRLAEPEEVAGLLAGEWSDGYLAFSTEERRLAAVEKEARAGLVREQLRDTHDIEGCLNEAGLWRHDGGSAYAEVAIDRMADRFLVQEFRLRTDVGGPDANCLWRAMTAISGSTLFQGRFEAMEVVHPQTRLHIFLSVGPTGGKP